MDDFGLYVHIPFCKSKCLYCDFNSYGGKEDLQEEYIVSLKRELDMRSSMLDRNDITSIYVGGGTPTFLNSKSFESLLSNLQKYVSSDTEYTIEANPGTLSREKLKLMKSYGVNRLSIGLQSWDDNILRSLGRIHCLDEFIENYNCARDLGFLNINVDLMFSIYGQTIDAFDKTIKNVVSLAPEHISCYSLIIEEGTPFKAMLESGKIKEMDEETDRDMFHLAIEKLKAAGYVHYEISNFAKKGFMCRHNINYWKTGPYLGVGAGAHSYTDCCRFFNESLPENYIDILHDLKLPVVHEDFLTPQDMMSEFMFMKLRMMEGVGLNEFEEKFGVGLLNVYQSEIKKMINLGLLEFKDERLALTLRGIDLSNQVFVEFI